MTERLRHIDLMRGLAILFMVEAHAAATFRPDGVEDSSVLALVVASIAGLAAPLFVTISGWGLHRSAKRRTGVDFAGWMRWLGPRVAVLTACQLLVNLVMSYIFSWSAPGVLTLLAIVALLSPLLARLSTPVRSALFVLLVAIPSLFPDLTGVALTWDDRVSVAGVGVWLARLLFDGTYPLLPWLSFALLGGLLADFDEISRKRVLSLGVLLSIGSAIYSGISGTTWALTSGDAMLTFFPASSTFLVVATTTVLAIHELTLRATLPKEGLVKWTSNLGRLSLSVYVLHFVPLAIYYRMVETPPSLLVGMALTLAYVLIWIPIGTYWFERAGGYSLEALLQRLTSQTP